MKVEIIRGQPYTAKFVIKENGSGLPLPLDPSDQGTFTISEEGTTPVVVIDDAPMTITDPENGEFTLELTSEQTCKLAGSVGFQEDRFPSMPKYTGVAKFNTVGQGYMQAVVPVFVRDIGEDCAEQPV